MFINIFVVVFWIHFYFKFIFFFKQKTAYEIGSGLVGSEMCIRDRHGTFCSAVFENEVSRESAIDAINNFDGIEYWDDPLPTPLDAEGRDNVLASRMREGLSSKKILNFWVVSDNLLKGAALNAVQICLLYTSPSPRDRSLSRMPSSA